MNENKKMFTREDAYKTLEIINMWINNCDTKTSVVLSGIGVVSTIILSSDYARIIKRIIETTFFNFCNYKVFCLLFTFSLILIFCGILLLVMTIIPKIIISTDKCKFLSKWYYERARERNEKKLKKAGVDAQNSIMFYGIIALKEYPNYVGEIKSKTSSSDELIKDLVFQIHSAAIICNSKFKKFQKGMILFSLGIILFVACVVFEYYKLYY